MSLPAGRREQLAARLGSLSLAQRARLAQQVRERKAAAAALPEETTFPLSHVQWIMWFAHELAPESPAYNVGFAVRVRSPLDPELLRRSFERLAARHGALRTTYSLDAEGRPVQTVGSAAEPGFEVVDAAHWSPEELDRCMGEAYRRPFDLERGPVVRLYLFSRSEREHVLLLAAHHIAIDLWSISILFQELATLYAAELVGQPACLSVPKVSYAGYVRWQEQMLASDEGERHWSFWREQLAGPLPVLELPLDRPRPPAHRLRGATHLFRLGRWLTTALKELASRERKTLYTVVLAAFEVLVHRYTGAKDVLVGSPMACRSRSELAGTVGCLINFVLLRGDLRGDPSFLDLLGRFGDVVAAALEHQDYPFHVLTERLGLEHDPSRPALAEVAFSLDKALFLPGDAEARSGFDMEPLPFLAQQEGQFDLYLEMAELDGEIVAALRYNTDLFEAQTAATMAARFTVLLAGIASDPHQRIGDLPVETAAASRQQAEWNATSSPYPRQRRLHELVAEQASRMPQAEAAVCGGERLSYAELVSRWRRQARALRAGGAGRGDVVALLGARGNDFLTAILASFEAGCAYLPLDPHHPPARHAEILRRSGARLLLVDEALRPRADAALAALSGTAPAVLPLAAPATGDDAPLAVPTEPSDLAYVIFTSGSTGAPKGAMIVHDGMLNHLYAKVRDLDLSSSDVVVQNASQCFDISVWQFLSALLVGGRTVILDDDVALDPARLLTAVRGEGVTVLELVPSFWRLFLEELESSPGELALRWLPATGEALPVELCRRWLRLCPDVPVVNAYGPTECSDDVTHHVIDSPPPPQATSVPIGRAVANTELHVLEVAGRVQPSGVTGELYVGGTGVGRGYLNDPGRTAAAFLPDPFVGRLDEGRFRRAWATATGRHDVLRTSFHYAELEQPLQLVHPEAEIPIEVLDWQTLSAKQRQRAEADYLEKDRRRGFVLETPPLLRLTLARVEPERSELFLSFHHLVLDGWSMILLLKEVFAVYAAYAGERALELPAVRPFGDHVRWLSSQDLSAAESYWRRQLAGFTAPTPLGGRVAGAGEAGGTSAEQALFLDPDDSEELRAFARRNRLTLATLVRGAWAILLGRFAGTREVVFGATVAGRAAGLPDAGDMVGLFVNTLPVRAALPEEAEVLAWLEGLQRQEIEARPFEATPLVEVRSWSEVPRDLPLFESNLVFENYPLEGLLDDLPAGLSVVAARAHERGNYPLTVMALPGKRLTLAMSYDTARLEGATVHWLLDQMQLLLHAMATGQARRLSELRVPTAAARQRPGGTLEDLSRLGHQVELRGPEPRPRDGYTAPRNEVEELLATIFAEILGVAKIGVQDSFFELGGHSLMATRVISRLNKTFKTQVAMRSLFEHPTVAGVAEALRSEEKQSGRTEAVARLHKELAGMNPEEVRAALAARRRDVPGKPAGA